MVDGYGGNVPPRLVTNLFSLPRRTVAIPRNRSPLQIQRIVTGVETCTIRSRSGRMICGMKPPPQTNKAECQK